LKSSGSGEGNRAESVSSRARWTRQTALLLGGEGEGEQGKRSKQCIEQGERLRGRHWGGESNKGWFGSGPGSRARYDPSRPLVGEGTRWRGAEPEGATRSKRRRSGQRGGEDVQRHGASEGRAEGRGDVGWGCWGVVGWRCAGCDFSLVVWFEGWPAREKGPVLVRGSQRWARYRRSPAPERHQSTLLCSSRVLELRLPLLSTRRM
jgi:hypothetical protein